MQFRFSKLLGIGSFGEVWHTQLSQGGEVLEHGFAGKLSFCTLSQESAQHEIGNLVKIRFLNHDGIIKLHGWYELGDRLLILFELGEETLLSRMEQYRSRGQQFPVPELLKHTRLIAEALDYLHNGGMMHGGVNPTDIVMCGETAKVGDFFHLDLNHSVDWHGVVIPCYKSLCMSPELRRRTPTKESDQYALAATYAWLRLQRPIVSTIPDGRLDLGPLSVLEQDVLLSALSDNPAHRFSSCIEFAKALDNATGGAPGDAPSPSVRVDGDVAL
jgi:serine/threonine-protein kinase